MSPPPLILSANSHGGIGWPTGAVKDPRTGRENNQVLYDLMGDGAATLLLEPEARWHYTEASLALPNSLVIWRCVPQQGKRPAELGWDGKRLAEHVYYNMKWHVDERDGIWPRDVTIINEPSLNYERGDNLNDTDPSTWPYVIENSANVQGAARHWLINKYGLKDTRFWFSAWSPGHGHWEHQDLWVDVARSFDGIIFHEYGMMEWIKAEYDRYREVFGPSIPLVLGEYNTDPNVFPGGNDEDARHEEEKVIKAGLGDIRAADPNFAGIYFIMRWDGGDRRYMDIDGHPRRRALWPFPPVQDVVPLPPPAPIEPPPPPPPPVEPEPVPVPVEPILKHDPWQWWTAEQIARAIHQGSNFDTLLANVKTQWPKVLEQMQHCNIIERDVAIGIICTMAIETLEFYPVKEGYYLGEPEPAESYRKTLRYYPWYGMGDVQLTHPGNFELYSRKINELWDAGGAINLMADPSQALDPDIAAAVIALWFRDTRALPTRSWPGGYSLIDACRAHDWEWCRILVQGGTAKLSEFTEMAETLLHTNAPSEPVPVPSNWDATPIRAEEVAGVYGTRAIWLHEISAYPSIPNLAALVKRQGYDAVYLKAGNGGYASPESGSVRWPKQWNAATINAFRAEGLKVVPWVYMYAYGKDPNGDAWMGPAAEADMLPYIRKVYRDATGSDCPIILDAEYEVIGQQQGCAEFAQRVKEYSIPRRDLAYAPDFRIAFGNRWPTVRQARADGGNFPWDVFNDLCSFVMPQTYYHMFGLSRAEGSYNLCDAWQKTYQTDHVVIPIFDQGPDIVEAVREALEGGYPSISVWAFEPSQPNLYIPAPAPDPDPAPQPETPPLPGPADPYLIRPDLDETGPNEAINAKPRYFQVIDEGRVAWHHSTQQFQDNYWANCGPIAMAHVVNQIRWRQNNPTTLNAGDAVEVTERLLPETVILQTLDPAKPQWVIPKDTFVYGAGSGGVMTYNVFGLGAFAKLLTGIDMICQSTEAWMPGPSLKWADALEIAKTRPIVVNKPGHIATVIRDKSGRDLLWLVQANIGPSFNGDGGALTAANWGQWNWQTWYPAVPLWGVAATDTAEELTEVQRIEYEARIAQLTMQVEDLLNRQGGLVTGLGLASGDYSNALVGSTEALTKEAKRLDEVLTVLKTLTSAKAKQALVTAESVQMRVNQIGTGEVLPVVGALRALKPPAS